MTLFTLFGRARSADSEAVRQAATPITCVQAGSGLASRGDVGSLAPALVSGCEGPAGTKAGSFAEPDPSPFLFLFYFVLLFFFFLSWPPARPALLAGRAGQGQAMLFASSHGKAAMGARSYHLLI